MVPARPRASTSWPRLRVPVVRRDRLLAQLGGILDESGPPLALLSAPAGFGKTTLLSQFCQDVTETDRGQVAWVSLETSGSYAGSIWRAILSALEASSPEAAHATADLLRPRRSPDDAFLGRFLERTARLPSPTILVLDDTQILTSSATVRQLGIVCRRLPPPMRLVISSRHDPAFSLHEVRLAGNLVELRAGELAFSAAETAEVLQDLPLDGSDIAAVVRLTEGWPAGVQLARSVLRRPGDGGRLAALFETQAGVLADYLFQESFTATSAAAQDILLRTSVVEQFTDDLAVDLTGRTDAGAVISTMTDLAPLLDRFDGPDGQEVWYRYHPLLRSYLVAELARRDRTLLRTSHRRATRWLAQHGDPLESIRHALASTDRDLVDAILLRFAPGMLLTGDGEQLRHELSGQHYFTTGWLSALKAYAAAQAGETAVARRWLAETDVEVDPTDRRLLGLRSVVSLRVDHVDGRPITPPEQCAETQSLPEDDLRLLITSTRGAALLNGPNPDQAERDLEQGISMATTLGRSLAELQCRSLWAAAALGRGDYLDTAQRVRDVLERATELDIPDEPILMYTDVLLGWVAFKQLDDTGATEHLDRAVRGFDGTLDSLVADAARSQADLLGTALHADRAGERRELPDWVSHLHVSLPTSLRVYACFAHVRHTLGTGRPELVRRAIREAAAVLPWGGDVAILQAMALSAQGRHRAATRLLRPVLDESLECLVGSSLVQALLIDAIGAIRSDRSFQAFDDLRRALAICVATGGYRELATAAPDLLAYVAEQSDRLDPYRDLIGRVLDYARQTSETPPMAQLTERELDILRELPTLDHVDEIAANLMVSSNTVKTHIRAIYRKLEVGSRSEAVRVARRRGLL